MVLGRLSVPDNLLVDSNLKSLILECCGSRIMKTRIMAAKAYVSITSTNQIVGIIQNLFLKVTYNNQNFTHGVFLIVSDLLDRLHGSGNVPGFSQLISCFSNILHFSGDSNKCLFTREFSLEMTARFVNYCIDESSAHIRVIIDSILSEATKITKLKSENRLICKESLLNTAVNILFSWSLDSKFTTFGVKSFIEFAQDFLILDSHVHVQLYVLENMFNVDQSILDSLLVQVISIFFNTSSNDVRSAASKLLLKSKAYIPYNELVPFCFTKIKSLKIEKHILIELLGKSLNGKGRSDQCSISDFNSYLSILQDSTEFSTVLAQRRSAAISMQYLTSVSHSKSSLEFLKILDAFLTDADSEVRHEAAKATSLLLEIDLSTSVIIREQLMRHFLLRLCDNQSEVNEFLSSLFLTSKDKLDAVLFDNQSENSYKDNIQDLSIITRLILSSDILIEKIIVPDQINHIISALSEPLDLPQKLKISFCNKLIKANFEHTRGLVNENSSE